MKLKIFLVILFLSAEMFAQEINIVKYLQEIEAGNAVVVSRMLPDLLKGHPNDPSLIFLDAVLTEDGESSLSKYEKVYTNYPKSNYADASLYRIFSYYFALGVYNKAENYLSELKTNYPNSPYLKFANRNIPNEGNELFAAKTKERKPAPRKPKSISVGSEINFTVQAGAFLSKSNAKSLADKLEQKGVKTFIYEKEVGGALLNVVTAGLFVKKDEAEKLLVMLKSDFNINGRIVPAKH